MNPLHAFLPIYLASVAAEAALDRRARMRDPSRPSVYSGGDTVGNFCVGLTNLVLGALTETWLIAGYVLLHRHFALFRLEDSSPATWLVAIVGSEFIYYWKHRLDHRVGFLWAGHALHHQSEEFNLSVYMRLGWAGGWFQSVFYAPLALLGVSPPVFFLVKTFTLVYQSWLHTRLIGRLGPFERVLNTPSHHRVHHAVNPGYLDRNYGGTFIVFDRLFGTFAPETVPPVYGTREPLRSWNPLRANLQVWATLARQSWRTRSPRPFLAPPSLEGAPPPPPAPTLPRHPGALAYLLAQATIALAASLAFLARGGALDPPARWAVGAFLLVSLVSVGALAERRRWAIPLEVARGVGAVALAAWLA